MSLKLLARNLKYLMVKKGLDKKDIQQSLRLKSDSRIEAWLSGRSAPKWEQLTDMCDVVGYYDIYKLFKVDISRTREPERTRLPGNVKLRLNEIKEAVSGILKEA